MLDNYRQQIDQLDQQIIKLLDQRFAVTKQVGQYKREHQLPVLNQDREQVIIKKINSMELQNPEQIIAVYQALMDISKQQQDE